MSRRCRSHATKRRYPSRPMAVQALEQVRTHLGPTARGPVRVYRCEHCGGWFLTSWDRAPATGEAR